MKIKRYILAPVLFAASFSLFANDLCVLSLKTNKEYECETRKEFIGMNYITLDFTILVKDENYPKVIECKMLSSGYVEQNHTTGGGYNLAYLTGETFRLYKYKDEHSKNLIKMHFGSFQEQHLKLSCSPYTNGY